MVAWGAAEAGSKCIGPRAWALMDPRNACASPPDALSRRHAAWCLACRYLPLAGAGGAGDASGAAEEDHD